jgi:hypothetical protein
LEQTTDEREEAVEYFDQVNIHVKRCFNEIVENHFKRMNSIINDKTRSTAERLKELFRRDGAIITAIAMTVSTIIFSVFSRASPSTGPSPPPPNQNPVKRGLVKVANWLLRLAKKALVALPEVIGTLISLFLKKARVYAILI